MNPMTVINNLKDGARKDPKKAGVLAFLVVVMAGMWVKVMWRSEPASASAAAHAPSAAATTPDTDARFVFPSDKRRAAGKTQMFWSKVPTAASGRNLFAVEYDRYPKVNKGPDNGTNGESGQAVGDAAKSGPSPADVKRERQAFAENIREQAAQLKLQTTIMGASPKALVNGQLVGEGDVVAFFRIVKITARGMVIEREGIKLEIQMKL
jgi:hypothetical protein